MAYTTNPKMPTIRAQAVNLVRKGWSTRKVARYMGYNQSAIVKWTKKAKTRRYGAIPTLSSRPKHHPKELDAEVVKKIVAARIELRRCAEVVHKTLENEGIVVSLSSVKRTLDRHYLIKKKSPWKRWHFSFRRPPAEKPGSLVQIDTIHLMVSEKKRIYIYTLIDVHSRWTYAIPARKISAGNSIKFVKLAQMHAPFTFQHIQSDNGPEFSTYFTQNLGILHRHTRVRRSNDNAHIERFNRTLQEECVDRLPRDVSVIGKALPAYLKYYNEKRLHFGIELQAPIQVINNKVIPRY
jgi:transposase InsO family protein